MRSPKFEMNQEFLHQFFFVLDELAVELLRLRQQPLAVEHKAGVGSQAALVTAADTYADTFLRTELKKRFSNIGFITEEGANHAEEEYVWVIDPIDGTNNYAHGLDMFGVSIGLWNQDGSSIFGCIDLPARHSRIWGGKGMGVWLDGAQIQSQGPLYPEKPLVLLAPIWTDSTQASEVSKALADRVGHTRDHGSSSWQSYLVLTGKSEAALHFRLSIWDIGAAIPLAQELGLSVVFSQANQLEKLLQSFQSPVTVAIGHGDLPQELISAVEPWAA
ncbi:inositol monophosphatase family protein [Candidatus Woesebacteria bacterium]|nr:inositol monophosphatase family protein [Candidatus Woesebacteria bacterium]